MEMGLTAGLDVPKLSFGAKEIPKKEMQKKTNLYFL